MGLMGPPFPYCQAPTGCSDRVPMDGKELR